MEKNDSKKLWLDLEKEHVPEDKFNLGPYTTQAYYDDPVCLSFITSRYKFCAKMLSGLDTVLEIGCGDGFGGAIVSQKVKELYCTDINESLLKDNESRMEHFSNIKYELKEIISIFKSIAKKEYGKEVDFSVDKKLLRPPKNELGDFTLNNKKAFRILNWKPNISLEEGIKMIFNKESKLYD